MSTSKILFQLSGSIACFKACALLSSLVKAGHEVEVVATASALKFVGEATLEGLTGKRVHTSTFESGRYMSHIHLMRWADLIVLAPASANTLNKFASGVADDLVTTLFLAHDFSKPYLVAPAMNQSMYAHPATQASLSRLSSWGVTVLSTGTGALACGEQGEGRMLEPSDIERAIERAVGSALGATDDGRTPARTSLQSSDAAYRPSTVGIERTQSTSNNGRQHSQANADARQSAGQSAPQSSRKPIAAPGTGPIAKRILITSGGTEEPIDGVRSITNTSSGRTGAELATWFSEHGYNVTLLHARNAVLPASERNLTLKAFSSFTSLDSALKQTLSAQDFDVVIHLAAVADYSLAEVESNGAVHRAPIKGKIDSGEELTLKLKRNPKLVDQLRAYSRNKAIKVVAFKLTRTEDSGERTDAVAKLFSHAMPDIIVHNDLNEIVDGQHPFSIFTAASRSPSSPPSQPSPLSASPRKTNGPETLAQELARLLEPGASL